MNIVLKSVVYCLVLLTLSVCTSHSVPPRQQPDQRHADSFAAPDPEIYMDFCQTARYHEYNCEEFTNQVKTEDGYLLTLQRLNSKKPSKSQKKPVYMMHGLTVNSYTYIMNLPENSLAFILADAGYDVWLGNSRGTSKCLKHVKYNKHQKEFWDYSWQEMAQYDTPASIDFVLNQTGVHSIPYIGHSQGTLMAFVHAALTNTDKISHLIALAPIFHVGHIDGALYKFVMPFRHILGQIFEDISNGSFLPANNFSQWEATHLCAHPLLRSLCDGVLYATCGFDSKYLNQTRMPVYAAHTPEGTSVRDILHFAQMVANDTCSFYDFGSPTANMKKYNGSANPPVFYPQQVKLPVSIFSAEKDILANPKDVDYLRQNLPKLVNDVTIPDWDHADFVIALNLPTRIAGIITDILDSVEARV